MVRPCVARGFDALVLGLASMYPASIWSVAPGHHGYQRAIDLITKQGSLGHLSHQFSIAPGRPASIASRPLADLGGDFDSLNHGHLANFPWFDCDLSLVPTCASPGQPRGGTVSAGRRAGVAAITGFSSHALTGPSTAPGSGRLGRGIALPLRHEPASPGQHRPCDACQLVSQRDRQDVVVQTLLGRLDPGLQAMPLPAA